MLSDIRAILWKEWRELFQQRGMRGAIFNWAVMVGLVGIFMPLQSGPGWLTTPVLMLVWSWMPLLAAMQIVADTFAGERERHTLETLLASRLPDRTILWGKVLNVVLYGWSIQIGSLIAGLVTINLVYRSAGLLFYSPDILFGVVPVGMLLVVLVASLGTLVSLRSATMRQAYQKMSLVFMAIVFIPFIGSRLFPQLSGMVSGLADFKPDMLTYFIAIAALLVLNAVVLWIGARRFERERLVAEI